MFQDQGRTQTATVGTETLAEQILSISHPLQNDAGLDPLMDLIGDSRFVLLGEASHGTSEFYRWRARLTKRLFQEKGFNFMSVEGDWPDCYRVNRYVKGYPDSGGSAYDVQHAFGRWPTWMWANWEIVALTEWMRNFNEGRSQKAGFYGLDVYSLWESMEAIIHYLQKKDPEAVKTAIEAYRCFEPYGEDEQRYAWSTRMVDQSCEKEVVDLLIEMQQRAARYDGDPEASFNAEQNALVMVNAEHYYRTMVQSDSNSWNVRDQHMAETLDRLMDFHGPHAKGIVWAHNTHVGDARFTDMARAGMFNIGQLVREGHDNQGVVLVGFSANQGSVIAGREWGAEMQVLPVPAGKEGSWEDFMHKASPQDKLMLLGPARNWPAFSRMRGHRAIGVVYNPEYESFSNYVPTTLARRYDAMLYIDQTVALHPLHLKPISSEPPELYPWGL